MINEHEEAMNERLAKQAKFRTKSGFIQPKKENPNEHPKKPA